MGRGRAVDGAVKLTRQRWEYLVRRVDDNDGVDETDLLNEMGDHDWELVAVIYSAATFMYFKRPRENV